MIIDKQRGFYLKIFKNGNGHLFFEPDTLKDINRALSEYYGDILPDCAEEEFEVEIKDCEDLEEARKEAHTEAISSSNPNSILNHIEHDNSQLDDIRLISSSGGDEPELERCNQTIDMFK